MEKMIQYLKDNKYIILSAFLPLFLIFSAAYGFVWFVEKQQLEGLQEEGFESHEEYFKYRNKQQAEIYELTVEIREIKEDMAEFLGESNE